MAGLAGPGGSGVTIEGARQRAAAQDSNTHVALIGLRLDPPREVFSQIRAYLLRRSEEMKTRNNTYQLVKFYPSKHRAQIELGPTIDNGPTPEHFRFDSGARLSFGLTLGEVDRGSRVLSFRYHYEFPNGKSPKFLRFDLNDEPHPNPLLEPRCHLHPGIEDLRIPFSVHHPIEILDRIFFVLERAA